MPQYLADEHGSTGDHSVANRGSEAVRKGGVSGPLVIAPEHRRLLVDEPVGIVLTGCEPGADVAVKATVDDGANVYEAAATFEADASGTVDTAVSASRDGTYTGVDPFGLWWSGEHTGPSSASSRASIVASVRADSSGATAEGVMERIWHSPGVTVTEVRDSDVWGTFARPAGPGPFPAIVAFGGSGGGLGPAAAWGPVLASHGLAVLAMAYFGVPGLPTDLVRIEVETVERAVAWLRRRDDVSGEGVAVMGQSRGSELALLAGALLDHVAAVVAFAPSGISWDGLDGRGPVKAPAWTYRGADLPFTTAGGLPIGPKTSVPISLRSAFTSVLGDRPAIEAAEIPVERVRGPIMLVSGEEDAMWPSTEMSELVERRAAEHGFAHPVVHLRYPDAGHVCAGVPGTPVVTVVPKHPLTGAAYAFGGSRAGNARARADSWPRVIEFLHGALPLNRMSP